MATTDWHVVGVASFKHQGDLTRINEQMDGFDSRRLKVVLHDLQEPIPHEKALSIGKIDYVLNLASDSHVDRSITHPRTAIENNVKVILTMLEYVREHPVEKFIHISTDEVYGAADIGHNHVEGEPHRPSNPYSGSKAAQEDIIFSYWRTYKLPLVITNTMNIVGEMQHPEKFVPKVLENLLAGNKVVIHASPDGKPGSRFYLHARNQADALLFLLKTHTPTLYPAKDIDRFNIVGEKEMDNLEMAKLLARYAEMPLTYELVDFHSSRPGHDLRYALDGKKMKDLGWKPPVSLEDSLKQTASWYLGRRSRF